MYALYRKLYDPQEDTETLSAGCCHCGDLPASSTIRKRILKQVDVALYPADNRRKLYDPQEDTETIFKDEG